MRTLFNIFRYLVFFPDRVYPQVREFRLYVLWLVYFAATLSIALAAAGYRILTLRAKAESIEFLDFLIHWFIPFTLIVAGVGLVYVSILFLWAKTISRKIKPRDIGFLFTAASGLIFVFLLPFNAISVAVAWFQITSIPEYSITLFGINIFAVLSSIYGHHQIFESNHKFGLLKSFLIVFSTLATCFFIPGIIFILALIIRMADSA